MDINTLVQTAASLKASDLHLAWCQPPKIRVDGQLVDMPGMPALSDDDLEDLARQMYGKDMPAEGERDLAMRVASRRVRVNIYRQRGHVSAALRLLNDNIPDLDKLGLPDAVKSFPDLKRGIVLVTGETGSGKSTTLAAVLQRINETRHAHIITLEDPIEYEYTPDKCLIDQREIGSDTSDYAAGLRAILREDPDVILIGEMRDLETIETALTAAETGHLVFATLHTASAGDSIDRIVGVFPADRQRQIRMQLSMTLMAVLSQQLLPRIGGGRVCACETMIVNPAIRNLIREGNTPQITNTIATTASIGNISMDNAVINLCRDGVIAPETAVSAARDYDFVKEKLHLGNMSNMRRR